MAFVKSGWLLRQSTILKRWKKNWFDLWLDGHLIYYDDQTRQSIEDKVHMPVDCINIRVGHECRDIQPPDGKSKDCMLQIVCRDGKTISLCAESTDDCAWQLPCSHRLSSLTQAYVGSAVMTDETAVVSSPPPYTAYATPTPEQAYGYGPYSGAYPPGTQVVYAANGQAYAVPYQYPYAEICFFLSFLGLYGQQPTNQVIIRERYRDNDSDLALGMLAGAATGMALGSLFWVF
uniref:Pleckstrin homology domain containing B2 n=1 Tax=Prolemur simus TaxID=1328070 RepID=A0A8C8ZT09_PROSS